MARLRLRLHIVSGDILVGGMHPRRGMVAGDEMIKIDWHGVLVSLLHPYSVFGFWMEPQDDAGEEFKLSWDKPVFNEPWHGCHRIAQVGDDDD